MNDEGGESLERLLLYPIESSLGISSDIKDSESLTELGDEICLSFESWYESAVLLSID